MCCGWVTDDSVVYHHHHHHLDRYPTRYLFGVIADSAGIDDDDDGEEVEAEAEAADAASSTAATLCKGRSLSSSEKW